MPTRKDITVAFLEEVAAGRVRQAFDRYVGAGFRHHNPYCKSGAQALMAGMEESGSHFPERKFGVQRVVAEGVMVAVHSSMVLKPGELELAVVHLLRFEGDRIVEFWDVGQQVPKDNPNADGMF